MLAWINIHHKLICSKYVAFPPFWWRFLFRFFLSLMPYALMLSTLLCQCIKLFGVFQRLCLCVRVLFTLCNLIFFLWHMYFCRMIVLVSHFAHFVYHDFGTFDLRQRETKCFSKSFSFFSFFSAAKETATKKTEWYNVFSLSSPHFGFFFIWVFRSFFALWKVFCVRKVIHLRYLF